VAPKIKKPAQRQAMVMKKPTFSGVGYNLFMLWKAGIFLLVVFIYGVLVGLSGKD
jgi:hypothetical protein